MPLDLFAPPVVADVLSADSYETFQARLRASGCSQCPDLCAGRTNIVVDRGNSRAMILAIGEGPGENEDRQGRAFVGRAGKLLDRMMASIGIDTNIDMLIVNVVKCRPPGNRAPTPAEARNCFPYLDRQLQFVKPRAVVLLGATAAKYFVDDPKISMKDRVGRFFMSARYPTSPFILFYHPAYLLRDPRKKKDAALHAQALHDFLIAQNIHPKGGNHESVNGGF